MENKCKAADCKKQSINRTPYCAEHMNRTSEVGLLVAQVSLLADILETLKGKK